MTQQFIEMPDVENDATLVYWLMTQAPHLARQILRVDPDALIKILDDLTTVDKSGKRELRPAFSNMPLVFRRIEVEPTAPPKPKSHLNDETQPPKSDDNPDITHHITRIVPAKTKRGGHFWQCLTAEGERVNAFQNNDLTRDTVQLFTIAGYDLPSAGEVHNWEQNPIRVRLEKNGKWNNLVFVEGRPANALAVIEETEPDQPLSKVRTEAIKQMRTMLDTPDLVVFDTETTGVGEDAEIVRFSAINGAGETLIDVMICPSEDGLKKLVEKDENGVSPADIHGLTPDILKTQPTFDEQHAHLAYMLEGKTLAAYNADYDTRLVRQDCARHGLESLIPDGTEVLDPMLVYAQYRGEWNALYGNWKYHKLSDALAHEGVEVLNAHDSVDDCRMTLSLMNHVAVKLTDADSQPEKQTGDIPF